MLRFSVALALLSPASAADYSMSMTSYTGSDWNGPEVPGTGWNSDWNNNFNWADWIPPNGVQLCTREKETPEDDQNAKYTFTSSFATSATTDGSWCNTDIGWSFKCANKNAVRVTTFADEDCTGAIRNRNLYLTEGVCMLVPLNSDGTSTSGGLWVELNSLSGCNDDIGSGNDDDDDDDSNGGGGGGGGTCFSRERAAACRLLDGGASVAAAHSACWGAATGSDAEGGVVTAMTAAALVPMSELVAGDRVLTEKGGTLSIDRVVVNQHRAASAAGSAAMLTLDHAAGSLTLTPGHVLWLDGGFAPARSAAVGSVLSNGLAITAITKHVGDIVNPIVAGGTILASDKAGGAPVLAATADEWTADVLLSAYPNFSPSCALAAAFPAAAQAYYDDMLEPLFNAAVPHLRSLKAAAPAPLVGLALIVGDASLAAGLGAYTLGFKGAATFAGAALAVVAARRATRK